LQNSLPPEETPDEARLRLVDSVDSLPESEMLVALLEPVRALWTDSAMFPEFPNSLVL